MWCGLTFECGCVDVDVPLRGLTAKQNKTLNVCQHCLRCDTWTFPPCSGLRAALPPWCCRGSAPSVGTTWGMAGQAGHCQGSQHSTWAFRQAFPEMETPLQQDSFNFHTSMCVFEEPVLWEFTVFVIYSVVIPIREMHTFLCILLFLVHSSSHTNCVRTSYFKVQHFLNFDGKCVMVFIYISLYELGFFGSSSNGKWWIKQVQISLWLLWGDPKIKANISLRLQMCGILKLFDMLKYTLLSKGKFQMHAHECTHTLTNTCTKMRISGVYF